MDSQSILGPEGLIAKRLPNYEYRKQQLAMADAVSEALYDGQHLVAEAGTGVGKSFGYLVPAILAVCNEDSKVKRVVISTHTISLQEQLLRKDIPFLNSVIPLEFTTVLAKGRRNYLSLRRLSNALKRADKLFDQEGEVQQLKDIQSWTHKTPDGSVSDLEFRPTGQVWDEVASDSGNCLGKKCTTHDQCFFYSARKRVHRAQIVIVNHALFFSDLALRRNGVQLLPPYDAVVMDEAHTVEGVAGNHMGVSVSSGQIEFALNKLSNETKQTGLFHLHNFSEGQQAVQECDFACDEFFEDIFLWHERQTRQTGRVYDAHIVKNTASPQLRHVAKLTRALAGGMADEGTEMELKNAANRLNDIADQIELWLGQNDEDYVYWINTTFNARRKKRRTELVSCPVDVGSVLRHELFDAVPSVIMTSATLSTASNSPAAFDFFKSRVGITQSKTTQQGSPFDFERQAKIILVDGIADPTEDKATFEQQVAAMTTRYIERTDGHAFVLFTSYDLLRKVESAIAGWLAKQNMRLFSQSSRMPRTKMVEEFKETPRSVLFGTDSFWQGVDVPGEALQNVIIPKLPFSVPDHPLLEARLDAIRFSGGNPFFEFQLPEAIIKLKQGFGRLIRTRDDHGIVVILDPRIQTRRYGRQFLQSLPECEIVREPYEEIRNTNLEIRNEFE